MKSWNLEELVIYFQVPKHSVHVPSSSSCFCLSTKSIHFYSRLVSSHPSLSISPKSFCLMQTHITILPLHQFTILLYLFVSFQGPVIQPPLLPPFSSFCSAIHLYPSFLPFYLPFPHSNYPQNIHYPWSSLPLSSILKRLRTPKTSKFLLPQK